MKRAIISFVAGAALLTSTAGVALADAPGGLEPNTHTQSNGSCVGVFSSQVTHNGVVVREQAQSGMRSELVAQAQAANCQRPNQ